MYQYYHSDWGKFSMKEKVSSSLDCPRTLVMKHFNTHNIQPRNILEILSPPYKLVTEVMFLICYVRE